MKKLLLGLSLILSVAIMAVSCSKDNAADEVILPRTANDFIAANFKNTKTVKVSRVDDKLTKKEYEVILENGIKIEFDGNGQWVEIEAVKDTDSIPSSFVPEAILAYVAEHYPGVGINGIELEDDGYEIELTDDTDLEFDLDFNFIKAD